MEFAISHLALFVLMYGDPQHASGGESAARASDMLFQLVGAIARTGRLREDVAPAVSMIESSSTGIALTLISDGVESHPNLSLRAGSDRFRNHRCRPVE